MPGGLDDPWGPFFREPYHLEPRYQKVFAPPVDCEPSFCFRAKDNFALAVVRAYRDKVLDAGVAGANSDFSLSIEEWLERAKAWREAYPELCKDPTF